MEKIGKTKARNKKEALEAAKKKYAGSATIKKVEPTGETMYSIFARETEGSRNFTREKFDGCRGDTCDIDENEPVKMCDILGVSKKDATKKFTSRNAQRNKNVPNWFDRKSYEVKECKSTGMKSYIIYGDKVDRDTQHWAHPTKVGFFDHRRTVRGNIRTMYIQANENLPDEQRYQIVSNWALSIVNYTGRDSREGQKALKVSVKAMEYAKKSKEDRFKPKVNLKGGWIKDDPNEKIKTDNGMGLTWFDLNGIERKINKRRDNKD